MKDCFERYRRHNSDPHPLESRPEEHLTLLFNKWNAEIMEPHVDSDQQNPGVGTPGDEHTAFEEYRGFMLHRGRDNQWAELPEHWRLSPGQKEMLVEVDIMNGLPGITTTVPGTGAKQTNMSVVKSALGKVADVFENRTAGADASVYYYIDDTSITFKSTMTTTELETNKDKNHEGTTRRRHFGYLFFANQWTDPNTIGLTQHHIGLNVFLEVVKHQYDLFRANPQGASLALSDVLAETVAHELAHSVLELDLAHRNWDEHIDNQDSDNEKFIMFERATERNCRELKFSDYTRRRLRFFDQEGLMP